MFYHLLHKQKLALKDYKNKVFKLKITQELRDRKEFLKPSVKKRLQKEEQRLQDGA